MKSYMVRTGAHEEIERILYISSSYVQTLPYKPLSAANITHCTNCKGV